MISVSVRHKGKDTESFLNKLKQRLYLRALSKYGEEGLTALRSATPSDTGLTASSWYYEIKIAEREATITWCNSNINKGYSIVLLLEYGHGTGTGGYVQGRHFIKPAIRPVFDKIAESAWKEVKNL